MTLKSLPSGSRIEYIPKFTGSGQLVRAFLSETFYTQKKENSDFEVVQIGVFEIVESSHIGVHQVHHNGRLLGEYYIQTNFVAPYIGFLKGKNVDIYDYTTGLKVGEGFSDYFTHPSFEITPEISSHRVYSILDLNTGNIKRIEMYSDEEMKEFKEKYGEDLYYACRNIKARYKEILI